MTLWFISLSLFGASLWILSHAFELPRFPRPARERRALEAVTAHIFELQECLEGGISLTTDQWSRTEKLAEPWGRLIHESLQELRAQGGSVVPTIKRLRDLAHEHHRAIAEAQARAAQALAQAVVCAFMGPALGLCLYYVMPGIAEHLGAWLIVVAFCEALALSGALWMTAMAERARWAGLEGPTRDWMLLVQCAGERFLSSVRAGTPADLAWERIHRGLERDSRSLAAHWGGSVWNRPQIPIPRNPTERTLIALAHALRKAIQTSVMEGRPCTERVESELRGLRSDLRSQIDRELSLLVSRSMKPLFLCVAPSVFFLIGSALYFAWQTGGLSNIGMPGHGL
ncbi:MAG: hypothetical protein AAB425_11205 [Bdellovibrionota bacterium]